MNTNNGLQGHAHPAWLHLYLATCKLLHLALSLPATRLPQFQMYRWAFVGDDVFAGDGDISNSSSNSDQLKATPNFIPYLTRIYRLLRNKVFAPFLLVGIISISIWKKDRVGIIKSELSIKISWSFSDYQTWKNSFVLFYNGLEKVLNCNCNHQQSYEYSLAGRCHHNSYFDEEHGWFNHAIF